MRLVVAAALLLAARTAAATTGGPTFVEVLGFDAPDAKIYIVTRFHDESGRLPEVHFVHTAGPKRGRATRVESIRKGLTETEFDVLEQRIATLGARLQSLRALPGAVVDPDGDSRVSAQLGQALGVKRTTKRTVRVPDYAAGTGTRPCRVVELQLTRGTLAGAIELRDCHPVSTGVVAAFPVPGTDALLAIVSSRPDDFELGYSVERPLLLVPAP
jgi:hypothetical protein